MADPGILAIWKDVRTGDEAEFEAWFQGRASRRTAGGDGLPVRAAAPGDQPLSMEEKLRGGDKKIKGALMIDTLRQAHAGNLGARFSKEFSGTQVGVFRVLCQIGRGDL
jgi:hypothetical protein